MSKQEIGVIGMGVMGRNLSFNIESKGYRVSIFNRSKEKTDEVINKNPTKHLIPFYAIKDFINSLEKPRRILLMVKAGNAIDKTIASLLPYLDKDDVIIDGGNSHFQDTIRRNRELLKQGFNFIGTGVSGGAEGALKGAAIMPGGQKEAYDLIVPIFQKIAAKFNGEPCVSYIGSDGAGHYVKMIHNGIEYADMQLIAEVYSILSNALKLNNEELANIFSEWNKGELGSYLIEITADIFRKRENKTNNYLIDMILDAADNKGTGKWTSQDALDLEIPTPLISESVFARYLSSLKEKRVKASKILSGPASNLFEGNKQDFIERVRRALYLGKVISYSQGFQQLKVASDRYEWKLDYSEIARIFQAGAIIRARILKKIIEAYRKNSFIDNLMLATYFKNISSKYQQSLRDVVCFSVRSGIALPALTSVVSYYDSYRSAVLPANLIQAQRDYFGAHTYKRIDKEGIFHTEWL